MLPDLPTYLLDPLPPVDFQQNPGPPGDPLFRLPPPDQGLQSRDVFRSLTAPLGVSDLPWGSPPSLESALILSQLHSLPNFGYTPLDLFALWGNVNFSCEPLKAGYS
jgi:hypothetical protein